MEWLTNVVNVLMGPGGAMFLMAAIGFTGYRGIWRWKRESDRVEAENKFLRSLVNQLAGVQEKQTDVNERAVTLAEVRAEIRSKRGPE